MFLFFQTFMLLLKRVSDLNTYLFCLFTQYVYFQVVNFFW